MPLQNVRVLVQELPIELVERVAGLMRIPALRHRRHLTPTPVQPLQRPAARSPSRPPRGPTSAANATADATQRATRGPDPDRWRHPCQRSFGVVFSLLFFTATHPAVCGCASHAVSPSPRSTGLSGPIRLSKRRPGNTGRRHGRRVCMLDSSGGLPAGAAGGCRWFRPISFDARAWLSSSAPDRGRWGIGRFWGLRERWAAGPISVLSRLRGRGACSPHSCPPGKDARPVPLARDNRTVVG